MKDDHLYDVAIQHHVLNQVGFDLEQAGILHLNKGYLYDGANLGLEALFLFNDLKGQIVQRMQDHRLNCGLAVSSIPQFHRQCREVSPWVRNALDYIGYYRTDGALLLNGPLNDSPHPPLNLTNQLNQSNQLNQLNDLTYPVF